MSDRISSYQMSTASLNNILRNQAQVAKTEQQVASGVRVLTPADDPVAAARILQLDQEIELTDQYLRNIDSARGKLELQDSTLNAVESTLQRVRELTVQANSGSNTQNDRKAIASEIQIRLEELLDQVNTKDATGEFLFSGYSGRTEPFTRSEGGGFVYNGDEGQRMVRISNSARIAASDNGKDIFQDVPVDKPTTNAFASPRNQGQPPGVISQAQIVDREKFEAFAPEDLIITFNNDLDANPPGKNFTVRTRSDNRVVEGLDNVAYHPGRAFEVAGQQVRLTGNPVAGDNFVVESTTKQGPLQTIEKLVQGLNTLTDSPTDTKALSNLVGDSLNNLDAAIENTSLYRARIGARINTAESTQDVHEETKLISQEVRSNLKDLDYAAAVSQLQMETMVLEAAQQAFAKVSGLSLFNFIR